MTTLFVLGIIFVVWAALYLGIAIIYVLSCWFKWTVIEQDWKEEVPNMRTNWLRRLLIIASLPQTIFKVYYGTAKNLIVMLKAYW